MRNERCIQARISKVTQGTVRETADWLVAEEPLEIRITYGPASERTTKSLSITMRTPGQDRELALGFLYTEGLIQSLDDVEAVDQPQHSDCGRSNTVTVQLKPHVSFDMKSLERHFYTTSSCGVCGKSSLEALHITGNPGISLPLPVVEADLIHHLPGLLREAQTMFESTGGLHAAALFDSDGNLLLLYEDVGRHNALDKLVGRSLDRHWIPLEDRILLLSGRASFELMQKALRAGLAVVAAVGAPSSLAVEVASQYNMTLIGFVRDNRFNIYTGRHRVRIPVTGALGQ